MFNNIILTALNKLSEQSEFSVHAEWQGDGGVEAASQARASAVGVSPIVSTN